MVEAHKKKKNRSTVLYVEEVRYLAYLKARYFTFQDWDGIDGITVM